MPQVNWDSRYSVKVQRFDDDHQELFRTINTLHDAMMARRGQQVLQQVLDELLNYTKGHFAREEEVMRQAGYPKLQAQIDQHRQFTDKVKDLSTKYRNGELGLTVDTLDFLTDWLTKHIVGVDQQYSSFFNERGIV